MSVQLADQMREANLHCTVDGGQVALWHIHWWLVADTELESGGAPVDELNGTLRLQGRNSVVSVLWYHVSAVQQTSCHVLAVARVALDHLIVWLEASHCDLLYRVRLVR